MSVISTIVAFFTTDTTQWTKGIDGAGKDVDKLDKKFQGFLGGLKSSFGKSSTLGQLTKLAVGGGAIAGLSMAAKEVDEFVGKIADVSAAWKKGDADAGDMFETVAKGIPVLGSIWDAGRKIHEMWSGEAAALAEIKNIVKIQNDALEKRNKIIAQGKEQTEKWAEGARKAAEALEIAKTPEGRDRDLKKAQFENKDKLAAIDSEFAKNSGKADIEDTQKQLKALQGKTDDESVTKAQELNKTLATLQHNYNEELKSYQEERAAIVMTGAYNIQDIIDKAGAKETAAQDEAFAKQMEADQKAADERADAILKNQKKLEERGKELTEQSNPIDAYIDKVKELDTLLAANAINQKTYDAQKAKALAGYDQAATGGADQGYKSAATEVRRGSDIVVANPKIETPLADLNTKAALALKEAQESTGYLAAVASAAAGRVLVSF